MTGDKLSWGHGVTDSVLLGEAVEPHHAHLGDPDHDRVRERFPERQSTPCASDVFLLGSDAVIN